MFEIISLIKRNIKIYLRDPLAVFFSFLSTIILMMIYILFLGNIGGDELGALLTNNEMRFLIYSQMMAGIIVLNTLTIPLGNLGSIVTDFEDNKMDAFMVTPVKRYKIIFGYYIASLIITFVLSLLFWILAVIVLGLVTGIFFPFKIIITIIPIILLFVFISTSFMILLTTFIKSVNAFGAVSGIFGSLIGFISGIYIPLSSSSPQILKNISSVIPFTHMTIWVKGILLEPSYQTILNKTNGNQAVVDSVKDGFGANELGLLGLDISLPILIIGAALLSVILLLYSTYRLNKRIKI
ncbi:MAG TPA: ABC transporter permease [Tenericutes bacterium]|nr:ABC transporter permease [Mycoplasmatota bacterium]